MPITVNDSFDINAPKPGDLRYLAADLTPWASPAAAKSIPAGKRHKGLTVLIEENGDLSEWWWDVDTSDNGLHRKAVPAGYRSTKQIHVAIRTDGKTGTGSYLDPYDWSDPAVSLVHLQAWSAARVPMTIHMAEGRYVIHPAYHNARPGQTLWMLWSGLSIKGAGKDRTFIVPAENGPGGWSMLGTNYTGNQPPGSANATERITRISLTDFTIDGEMDYAQEYGDRTWAGLSMDGDNIDIRRVRITRLGGAAQELFPIIIYHTPTYDEMSRECGIFIDECEVVNVPYSVYTGCTGLIIAGGNTASTGDGHQIRNKYVVVSRCRLENAGSLGVSQMRNVYFNDCHVDPKGKLICMNIDTGPVYNIRFTNCTFIMGQDQFRHSGAANVGGGASIYEVSFNGCYFHSAINGYTQASVKLQGNAKVSLTDCTHEPSTIENKQWAEDANGNPIYGQDAATYNGWYGAIIYHIDGSVQGGGWHIKNGEEGNLLHCSGNRMFNGTALPAILCDTPPQPQVLGSWDNGGFMLNQTLILQVQDSGGWATSDTLFFQEITFKGGSVNTLYIGLPNIPNAKQGMRRVFTMVKDSSTNNLVVMLTGTDTVVDQVNMRPGTRVEYIFLDGAWKRHTDTTVSGYVPPYVVPEEVHVAIRTDGLPGSGTRLDPYDGSGTRFTDIIVAKSAENKPTNWYFGKGKFILKPSMAQAYGANQKLWDFRNGWHWQGAGRDQTTFALDQPRDQFTMFISNYPWITGVSVPAEYVYEGSIRGIKFDGIHEDVSFNRGERVIWLCGGKITIEDNEITRFGGMLGQYNEEFVVTLVGGGDGVPPDTMHRIEGNYIHHINYYEPGIPGTASLGQCAAIACMCTDWGYSDRVQVIIRNNRLVRAGYICMAINCIIDSNYVDSDFTGPCIHSDTGPYENVQVTNNTFLNAFYPWSAQGIIRVGGVTEFKNIRIYNNAGTIHGNGYTCAFVLLQGGAHADVRDNVILFNNGDPLCPTPIAAITVIGEGNQIFRNQDNRYANGELLGGSGSTNPVDGVTSLSLNTAASANTARVLNETMSGRQVQFLNVGANQPRMMLRGEVNLVQKTVDGHVGTYLVEAFWADVYNTTVKSVLLLIQASHRYADYWPNSFSFNAVGLTGVVGSVGVTLEVNAHAQLVFHVHFDGASLPRLFINVSSLSKAAYTPDPNQEVGLAPVWTLEAESDPEWESGAAVGGPKSLQPPASGGGSGIIEPPATKASLEALTGVANGSSVMVQNLYPNSPHSGGTFVLDVTSSAEVNNGTVLASSSGGRWLRQYTGPIDVRWFGAMPGVVADQSPAINAALSTDLYYFEPTGEYFGKASVFIPRGVWWINQPIKMWRGTILEGTGDNDQDGSTLTMMDNSNCSAIQTPHVHVPEARAIQYMRVRNLRINGRYANQTAEAIAVDWRGVYASSELSYLWVVEWLGPAYVTGGSADTSLNQLYALSIATDTYACQFSDVNQTGPNNQGGFMLIKDIYCEHVIKADQVPNRWNNPIRGNAFLFNRLVSVHARGLHTEYDACPITLRACQVVNIDGASGWGDGWSTMPVYDRDEDAEGERVLLAAGVPCAEGALIYVDDSLTFFSLHIGPYSCPSKAAGVQIFKPAPGVGFGVFPNTAGTEGEGYGWGGIDTVNNLVDQGRGKLKYGEITSGYNVTAGNPQSIHPRIVLTKDPYMDGPMPSHDFYTEFRTDPGWNICHVGSNVDSGDGQGIINRVHFAYGLYGTQGGFRLYDPIAFESEMTLGFKYMMGRTGENLYFRNATSTRKFLMEGDVVGGGTLAISGGGTGATTAAAARLSLDVAAAPILLVEEDSEVVLMADNTMSSKVIEAYYDVEVFVSLLDIDTIKPGDVWEVCQIGPGRLLVSTGTSILGQLVTLQFPPGGGRRTEGLWSTLTIRCRKKSGSLTTARATLLITGGVP